jgi:hypothetical protein
MKIVTFQRVVISYIIMADFITQFWVAPTITRFCVIVGDTLETM